jgi:hypothetical protein
VEFCDLLCFALVLGCVRWACISHFVLTIFFAPRLAGEQVGCVRKFNSIGNPELDDRQDAICEGVC